METCFVNLVEPGDKVIICQNGVFGGRMKENVERIGATPVMVEDNWGEAIDLNKLEDALINHPDAGIVAFVHAETSTGVQSDAAAIAKLAQKYDCLTIMDAVTSLGGTPVRIDEWGIDAVYSGTQKCLSCTPGLSPLSISDRAVDAIKSRKSKVQSWFLDLNLVMGYWGPNAKRAYHHTAPINALYGLHEALVMLEEEGIENAWARHQQHHNALKAGIEAMGLSFLVKPEHRLPQLNAVSVPDGVDEAAVRADLLANYNLEIGAGLGALAGKVWRIGLMGHACNMNNIILCLQALESALIKQKAPINRGLAVAAAQEVFEI
jgi:alanine-glyoxylate transaminase/serine-glyoxylate transaminase/serine-pyruvate transaminase